MSERVHLRGVLERILFANAETRFCIGELRPDGNDELIPILGVLPGVQCGETLELEGEWTSHKTHGPQFKVHQFRSTLPATVYGLRKYLGSGLVPGIGKVYANKIVDVFGLETLRIIEEESSRLREVPGIGKKRAGEIKEAWDSQRAQREVMMFLQTYGVTVGQCLRLVKQYGNQAIEILRNEPYRVAREIDGIGFRTADKIAINLGFANDSPQRLQAGVLFALRELEDDGHTAYAFGQLVDRAAELLEVQHDPIRSAVETLLRGKQLRQLEGSDLLQLPDTARAEQQVAQALQRLLQTPSPFPPIKVDAAVEWAAERSGFQFAPAQADAIRAALQHKITIITGGPGTGKTTILRAVVDILKAKKVKLMLASPTGRAAQRMTQSTGQQAATIHRLLKFDPITGGFTVDQSQPLRCDCLIVDECSMLDNRLAAALFQGLPAQAHLILVGDIHQLPSVGAGNILKDLMASGLFAVAELNQIFRQKEQSAIVSTAHGILQGFAKPPPAIARLSQPINPTQDLFFVEATDTDACIQSVRRLLLHTLPRFFPWANTKRDVQVLVPMHKGVVGIGNLNKELQQALNPNGRAVSFGSIQFREGDKVIQTRNNYDHQIFNGDLGVVSAVLPDAGTLAVDFDGNVIDFERSDLSDLQPAYAISIHKSQGSEFPIVVLPLLKQHFLLLQRNLLYTAITRGKRKVFIVGDPAAYAMAVRNAESLTRITGLPLRLAALREGI